MNTNASTLAASATKSAADSVPASAADDPYLWLEDVLGDDALAWVRERNARSEAVLQTEPGFAALRTRLQDILDSREQIPQVARRGPWLYNFWRDAANPRGLWRRTTLQDYRRPQPDWELVLDLDALARAEGENWVWAGATGLGPAHERVLIELSRGGADATVLREFDTVAKRFVTDGFTLPEAKSDVSWDDADHVFVATDFGAGSLTTSGYPRIIKRWRRGTPLADAVTVFEARPDDVGAYAVVDDTPGFERRAFGRQPTFYTSTLELLGSDGTLQPVDKPADASVHFWRDLWLFDLRSDWTTGGQTWPSGALLAIDAQAYLRGERGFTPLFLPTPTRSLSGMATTRSTLLLTVLDKVAGRLEAHTRDDQGRWQRREVAAPAPGNLALQGLHDPQQQDDALAEDYLLHYTDFLTPDSLLLGHTTPGAGPTHETLKSRPSFFDAAGMAVQQRLATSADGTRVPYFVVSPAQPAGAAAAEAPTLLYGYGGFEVSRTPFYSGSIGHAWLARGGTFVLANIRGGGEFGPAWHQAAIKAHKQRSYDDFIAVAEDLVAAGITQPQRLGIQGGSNGGLLVGAVMLQRPELFGAVVCQVPLLDMRRYHRLLAGASWMAEYGDPDDPAEWAVISRYSPYQRLAALPAGTKLPPLLLVTSTRDDRVHPGHARKFAARMEARGQRVLYWENIEGGHGGAADNAQRAQMMALEYSFLWRTLAG
jgi:prolyl oligopeptidase